MSFESDITQLLETENLNANHDFKCGGLGLDFGLNSRNFHEHEIQL